MCLAETTGSSSTVLLSICVMIQMTMMQLSCGPNRRHQKGLERVYWTSTIRLIRRGKSKRFKIMDRNERVVVEDTSSPRRQTTPEQDQ